MLMFPIAQGKRIAGERLREELLAAGVPVQSVIFTQNEVMVVGVNEAYREQVRQIVEAHVPPAERRPRTVAAIRDDVLAMTATQRARALAALIAVLARSMPGLLTVILEGTGTSIPEDEPAPAPDATPLRLS